MGGCVVVVDQSELPLVVGSVVVTRYRRLALPRKASFFFFRCKQQNFVVLKWSSRDFLLKYVSVQKPKGRAGTSVI